ncbi:hypothetical protein G6F40_016318 [Rhizopus arrhizus]|nr:hypothetical protein G6F40_016318 [Rhizopus arrhizus]
MEAMTASGIDYAIYFYNPNIHPVKEYEIRKQENIRFAEQHGIEFIDADYDMDNWFDRVKGMENAPERGERCTACFDMRFERTALSTAAANAPPPATTTWSTGPTTGARAAGPPA